MYHRLTSLPEDLLRDIAKGVCRGADGNIDLSEYFGTEIAAATVAELNGYVDGASDKLYRVEAADPVRFGLKPSGAIYCVRVDNRSREERLFLVSPAERGLRFCTEVLAHTQRTIKAVLSRQDLRAQFFRRSQDELESLLMECVVRIREHLDSANVTGERRDLVEACLGEIGDRLSATSMPSIAAACAVLDLSFPALLQAVSEKAPA